MDDSFESLRPFYEFEIRCSWEATFYAHKKVKESCSSCLWFPRMIGTHTHVFRLVFFRTFRDASCHWTTGKPHIPVVQRCTCPTQMSKWERMVSKFHQIHEKPWLCSKHCGQEIQCWWQVLIVWWMPGDLIVNVNHSAYSSLVDLVGWTPFLTLFFPYRGFPAW